MEVLTQLPASVAESCISATAGFIQTTSVPIIVDGVGAVPTCAAALLAIPKDSNRAPFTAPVTEDQIVTKKGDRFWVQAALHDWTGSVLVQVQDPTAPSLYACSSTEEV